jgi:hypothetical protein
LLSAQATTQLGSLATSDACEIGPAGKDTGTGAGIAFGVGAALATAGAGVAGGRGAETAAVGEFGVTRTAGSDCGACTGLTKGPKSKAPTASIEHPAATPTKVHCLGVQDFTDWVG